MFVTVGPAGTTAMYIPVSSVVKSCTLSELLMTATETFLMPDSPGSCTPLPFASSNTVPLIFPVAEAVGDLVGEAVGEPLLGDLVGASVGN